MISKLTISKRKTLVFLHNGQVSQSLQNKNDLIQKAGTITERCNGQKL